MPMPLGPPRLAIVRALAPSYASCLREHASEIDVARARSQHAAYVAALVEAGVTVEHAPALPDQPDGVFVEDVAVVVDRVAVRTRPGAPSRRPEGASIAPLLAHHRTLHAMRAPATLDGGDVLRIGDVLLVGRSRRTNAEGIARLAEVVAADGLRCIAVEVRAGLHLKSLCTLAAPDLVLAIPDAFDPRPVIDLGVRVQPVPEPAGANVLALGERVLVSAAAPQTAAILRAHGLAPVVLELSEIHAGDGALTCMSLRLAAPGTWCA